MKLLRPLLASLALSLAGLNPLRADPMNIEHRVDRLDALVHLTPKQKVEIAAVFREEDETIAQLAPENRMTKGADARQASRAGVRALLAPEQRKLYDVSPQSLGGGLTANPENMAMRLNQLVQLSPAQQKTATAIFWENITEQMAALPADQAPRGFNFTDKVRAELRAILTPEQQATFDVTPPYGKNRRAK